MDSEGEVQRRGIRRERDQLAVGREDVDLVGEQVQLEFVDEIEGIRFPSFEDFANLSEPGIDLVTALRRDGLGPLGGAEVRVRLVGTTAGFVTPVRRESALGHVVHASASDLDLHPFAGRGHHGRVQRLVAIRFGQADPIAQAVRVGLVEVSHDAVRAPDVCLLYTSPSPRDRQKSRMPSSA